MGATFPRAKIWAFEETVTSVDLNAEFDNLLTNLTPAGIDDASSDVANMQTTVDPGDIGSESLAVSLRGEIDRIRFMLKQIAGTAQWYEEADSTINELADQIESLPPNRLVNGRIRSATDTQPIFLVPDNTTNKVTLKGATTDFVYRIKGSLFTISSDVDLTGLSQAPSTNNTALVDDAALSDGPETRTIGENGSALTIGTVESEITSRVGTFQAFKINDGADDEFFTAFIETATSLTNARRGCCFDELDAPVPRLKIADGDTITLLRIAYVFAREDLTLTSTLNRPSVAADEPSSPANGDFWLDTTTDIWKVHNGSAFVDATAVYIGVAVTDDTNTVAARSNELFASYAAIGEDVKFEKATVGTIRSIGPDPAVDVRGIRFRFAPDNIEWSMADHLDDGDIYTGGEQASTDYYFYIDDFGDMHISDVEPYDRRDELFGFYHPYHSWRFFAKSNNDSGSDLVGVQLYPEEALIYLIGGNGKGSTNTAIRRFTTVSVNRGLDKMLLTQSATDGDSITILRAGRYSFFWNDGPAGAGVNQINGLHKNGTDFTSFAQSVTPAQEMIVLAGFGTNANEGTFLATTARLNEGDIIRPQVGASVSVSATIVRFGAEFIGD